MHQDGICKENQEMHHFYTILVIFTALGMRVDWVSATTREQDTMYVVLELRSYATVGYKDIITFIFLLMVQVECAVRMTLNWTMITHQILDC